MIELQSYLKVAENIILFILFTLASACDASDMKLFVFTKIVALITVVIFVLLNKKYFEFRRNKNEYRN